MTNMDYKDIEQLLERYWKCETSIEEEAALRNFFLKEDVPAHLLRYKNLFVYQQVQQEVGLGEDFDVRILAEVEPTVVKAKRLTLTGTGIRKRVASSCPERRWPHSLRASSCPG